MLRHLALLSVVCLASLVCALVNPCAGSKNLCADEVTGCEIIFPPVDADTPSDLCFDANYASFVAQCHKTCLICCVEPCEDVNPRCSAWNMGFCTNPFYSDEQRWAMCRKKCGLCQ